MITALTLLAAAWTFVLIVAARLCIIHRPKPAKAKARHLRIVR